MMNLLSSIRSYLDYTEINIKRRHGESSSNWTNFKRHTSDAYDGASPIGSCIGLEISPNIAAYL